MRRWFSMCSTRHSGMEVSRMTAFIVRSRTNVAIQSFHSSVVERIPDTGYRFTLNSRRHFLHFHCSLGNLYDRQNEQYGHVILVAMLDIPPVCGEILYAAAKNEDTEVANLDITLSIKKARISSGSSRQTPLNQRTISMPPPTTLPPDSRSPPIRPQDSIANLCRSSRCPGRRTASGE